MSLGTCEFIGSDLLHHDHNSSLYSILKATANSIKPIKKDTASLNNRDWKNIWGSTRNDMTFLYIYLDVNTEIHKAQNMSDNIFNSCFYAKLIFSPFIFNNSSLDSSTATFLIYYFSLLIINNWFRYPQYNWTQLLTWTFSKSATNAKK